MTVSTIGVADAGTPDKYLHTNQRTISSTAREDQYVLPGQSAYPTYTSYSGSVSVATANSHLLQIMGDGSNYGRLLRVRITIAGLASGSAAGGNFSIVRLSSAGTSGTAKTPAPFDTSNTYGGGSMTLPSSKGTEGATVGFVGGIWFPTTVTGTAPFITWTCGPEQPVIFGTATTNGIVIKNLDAVDPASVYVEALFLTTTFL